MLTEGDAIEQRGDYVPPPNRNAHENRIGKMITSIVLNFARTHKTFVLLHLETLVGNQFKDRRSWEIASDLAQKVAKRDGALPEVTSLSVAFWRFLALSGAFWRFLAHFGRVELLVRALADTERTFLS